MEAINDMKTPNITIDQEKLFEIARLSGLPISWWEKQKQEGNVREWRELQMFVSLILQDFFNIADSEIRRYADMDEWDLCNCIENYKEAVKEKFGVNQWK